MPELTIYAVPVRITGIQHHRVHADSPDQAVAAVLAAPHALIDDADVVSREFAEIAGPAVAEPRELPTIEVLIADGKLLATWPGRREYLFGGRRYSASWVIEGTPHWLISPIDGVGRQAG
jgi:hypothetical protein